MTLYSLSWCGTNQQEVQQEGCSQEGDVCKRSGHDSRQKTRTTGSVGGMEGGVQEGRTDNEREKTEEMWV